MVNLVKDFTLQFSILPTNTVIEVGNDVTDTLGIVKWERPISPQLYGQAKGISQSSYARRPRALYKILGIHLESYINETFEVTIKLDGSSYTIFVKDETDGVCSRNLELKQNEDNAFWRIALEYDVHKRFVHTVKILLYRRTEGNIQGNYEKVKTRVLRIRCI